MTEGMSPLHVLHVLKGGIRKPQQRFSPVKEAPPQMALGFFVNKKISANGVETVVEVFPFLPKGNANASFWRLERALKLNDMNVPSLCSEKVTNALVAAILNPCQQ